MMKPRHYLSALGCAALISALTGCGGSSSSLPASLGSSVSREVTPSPKPSPSPSPIPLKEPVRGFVTDLKPGVSFTLTPPPGAASATPLHVELSATTKIDGFDGKADTLVNGQDVTVSGDILTATHTVTADKVVVLPAPPFFGRVTGYKPGVSFTLIPPASAIDAAPVTVLLSSTTKIVGLDGKPADLADSRKVSVTGPLDPVLKTVNAEKVVVYPAPPFLGAVANLKAGTSFTLTPPAAAVDDVPLTVVLSASTKIVALDGMPATLADDRTVIVTGDLDPILKTVTATQVTVLPVPPFGGLVSNFKAGTGFTLTPPAGAPDAVPLTVVLTDTAKVIGLDGKPATVSDGDAVIVSGALDGATKTVTATTIVVLPQSPFGGIIHDLKAGTGFLLAPVPGAPNTTPLTVVLTADTKIVGLDGKPATLADEKPVVVTGPLDGETKTVTAKTILVLPVPPFAGTVSNLKAGVSFTLVPLAGAENAIPLTIDLSSATKIEGANGKPEALAIGQKVAVSGQLDPKARAIAATTVVIAKPK